MTPAEFHEQWERDDEPFVRWSLDALGAADIPDETRQFLTEVGLPTSAAPFLSFGAEAPEQLITLAEMLDLSDEFRKFFVIGNDGCGSPICLDEKENGAVVLMDHDNGFERVHVNASVQQLAKCLLAYRQLVYAANASNGGEALINGNIPPELLAQLRERVLSSDETALHKGTFWRSELDSLQAEVKEHAKLASTRERLAETMTDNPSKRTQNLTKKAVADRTRFLLTLGVVASWLCIVASFGAYKALANCGAPAASGTHVVEMCDHGEYFYITRAQATLFYGLLFGGVVGVASFGVARTVYGKRNRDLLSDEYSG